LSLFPIQLFTDGITNKLVGCFYNDLDNNTADVILVRIYGNKTDLLIDRDAEKRNITVLHKHGLAPELFATFTNGLCYEYVPGYTLNPNNICEPKIWRLVATHMAKMHKLPLTPEQSTAEPMLKTKTLRFLDLIPQQFADRVKQEK
jgi:ethanolamine kinase